MRKTATAKRVRRNSAEHNRKISLGMKRHYRSLKRTTSKRRGRS